MLADGWVLVFRDGQGAQLRKPRKWSPGCLMFGVILPALGGLLFAPLFAVAAVGMLVLVAHYLSTSDQTRYVPTPGASATHEQTALPDS